jgi:hypothetical protein
MRDAGLFCAEYTVFFLIGMTWKPLKFLAGFANKTKDKYLAVHALVWLCLWSVGLSGACRL